jgi:type I restriction enzyme, S subunit
MIMNKYENYKQTGFEWLGKIPKNWNLLRVSNLFNERNEKVDDISFPPLSVTMSGIVDQLLHVAKSDDHTNRKLVKKNDFVINSRSDRKGSSGISHRDGSVSLINIVLQPYGIDPKYAQYIFKSYYFKEEFFRNGKGIHWDLWSTRWDKLKNINIPVPSQYEQKSISKYLDRKIEQIDLLIKSIQNKIELLKEKRISLINHCVTKGVNSNIEMKDSGIEWIGKIPKHWFLTRLKFHGDVLIGLSFDKDDVVDEGEGTLVLRSSNVQNGKVSFHDNLWVKTKIPHKLFVKDGDILICSRNGSRKLIGKNCLLKNESLGMTWGVFMTVFRTKYSDFFYWVLNSQVFKSQSGLYLTSTINQLTASNLENLTFPFVSDLNEQQKINDYLTKKVGNIDENIKSETKKISLLKEYKESTIFLAVTGKMKIKENIG